MMLFHDEWELEASAMITGKHIEGMMYPKGVVVVGATERPGSVGRTVCENLTVPNSPFALHYVNPKRPEVLGKKCWTTISEIGPKGSSDNAHQSKENANESGSSDKSFERELVIVITPAQTCVSVVEDCCACAGTDRKVKAIIVIAAGFKEVGAEGLALEKKLVALAAANDIALVGPNCLGIQSPHHFLNASFASMPALTGSVAFISQSGAMCTAVLDWSLEKNLGFSAFVSLGSMAHVDWSSLLNFFAQDKHTKSVIIYMESAGAAGPFLAAARKVCATQKPIIVIKAGKTEAAAAAAVSHTGSMTGSDGTFRAAMRSAGCLVVDSIDEFQNLALLMATQPPPKTDDVVILTNAGGPGVLTTDAAVQANLTLPPLDEKVIAELNPILPAAWSHANPVDILGDASHVAYQKSLEIVQKNMASASVLVVLSPQSVTTPTETAQAVADSVIKLPASHPPVVAAWMGGKAVRDGKTLLQKLGIPCFDQPDQAAKALGQWREQLRLTQQLPAIPTCETNAKARTLLLELLEKGKKAHDEQASKAGSAKADSAKATSGGGEEAAGAASDVADGRFTLTEHDSKSLLKLYGIDVADSVISKTPEAAVASVSQVGGYPVVMKIHGGKFTHKSDIGCVKLNLKNEKDVEKAFQEIKQNYNKHDPEGFEAVVVQPMINLNNSLEVLCGCVHDPQFGPVVVFGAGGCMVEIWEDSASALAPVSPETAHNELMKHTKIYKALNPEKKSERFQGCDVKKISEQVSRFSLLCADLWEFFEEAEINPLVCTHDRIIAVDARIVVNYKGKENNCKPALLYKTPN